MTVFCPQNPRNVNVLHLFDNVVLKGKLKGEHAVCVKFTLKVFVILLFVCQKENPLTAVNLQYIYLLT